MVDFRLTQEQEELQRMAKRFAQTEITPVAARLDRDGEFPWEILKKAHELGLFYTGVPVEYGGGGLGVFEACLIAEELSAGCVGVATSILANDLAVTPIMIGGDPDQKKKYLGQVAGEFTLSAFCLTEAEAGSDVASMKSTARLEGDTYVLNGRKCFITNGGVARLYTVFASTDPSKKHKGISAFIVPADLPGVSTGKEEDKMGQRASNTTEVVFEDVPVPRENLLGQEGDGFKLAMATLDRTRPPTAASGVGVARAALEMSVEYARTRVTFNQPIAMHQAIAFMIADMAKDIEAARLTTWKAAWMADQGIRQSVESAIAKTLASDVAMRVATDAVQIFGGYGYMRDYPVEKLMRDAKLIQIYEGTNQIQRAVIARGVLTPS